MAMVDQGKIREHMPVISSDNQQFGTVDKVEGDSIKLTRDSSRDGQHHWMPMNWVTRIDEHVHVDRSGEQAMREWMSSPSQGMGSTQGRRAEGNAGSPM